MPQQFFVNIKLSIPEESYDLCYGLLNDYPIQGIEEGHDQLMISFREEDATEEFLRELIKLLQRAIPNVSVIHQERIEQQNWNESWEQSLEPIVISERTVITPSWHAESVHHPIKIIIDPKMSFGTGS